MQFCVNLTNQHTQLPSPAPESSGPLKKYCSLPMALLPVHERLHTQRPLCQALKGCRWHHTDRPHPRTVASLLTDRRLEELAVWCSLNKLVLNMLKMSMIMYFRRNPPLTIMNSTVTAVESFSFPGHHHLPGPEVGQSHRLHCEKSPAEALTSFAIWGSSICHRSCWKSSALQSLNQSSAHQ